MTTSVPTRLDTPCSSQIKAVPRQSLDPRASAPRLQERPGRRLGPALLSWVPWKWCQRAPSTPGWTKPSEWGCLPTVKEPSPHNCHLLLSSGVKCHTAPALTCLFPKSPARPWSALLSEAGESQQGPPCQASGLAPPEQTPSNRPTDLGRPTHTLASPAVGSVQTHHSLEPELHWQLGPPCLMPSRIRFDEDKNLRPLLRRVWGEQGHCPSVQQTMWAQSRPCQWVCPRARPLLPRTMARHHPMPPNTHTHSFPAQEWRQHLAGQQEPLSTGVHRDHTYKCTCHPKSPHLLPTIANAKSSRSNRRTWQPCVWPFIVLMYPLNGDICVLLQKR